MVRGVAGLKVYILELGKNGSAKKCHLSFLSGAVNGTDERLEGLLMQPPK